MSSVHEQASPLRPLEKVAALAGGAVVFTIVAYATRRLLERMFGPCSEAERVVIVVHSAEDVEVLPNESSSVVVAEREEGPL